MKTVGQDTFNLCFVQNCFIVFILCNIFLSLIFLTLKTKMSSIFEHLETAEEGTHTNDMFYSEQPISCSFHLGSYGLA